MEYPNFIDFTTTKDYHSVKDRISLNCDSTKKT